MTNSSPDLQSLIRKEKGRRKKGGRKEEERVEKI